MRFWKEGKMRSRLLNRGVFEAVRLSEPSQNLVSSSQLPICSSQPLPEVSSLERTPSRDLSAWSTLLVRSTLPDLEQFARANSTSLERTQPRSSEPFIKPPSLEPPSFARALMNWTSPLKRTPCPLERTVQNSWVFPIVFRYGISRFGWVVLMPITLERPRGWHKEIDLERNPTSEMYWELCIYQTV